MDLRAAAAVAALLCVGAGAPLKPLPSRSPEVIAPPSLVVHVRAHEDLEPDTLRAFARPRVTLWLDTRSNVLKKSTLENLRRFDLAYVRFRVPITETQARAFEAAPRAGVWLDAAHLDGKGLARVMGPRSLALQLKGPLDEAAFEQLQKVKPEWVEWQPPPEPDVMAYSFLKQLPGRKVVSLEPGGMQARSCGTADEPGPSSRTHLATLLALGTPAFPCGRGPIVVVPPDTDRWLIQSLVVKDPTAELELTVGADEALARKSLALLDELGFAPHR